MKVIKKDGTLEDYNEQKIINACSMAAKRALVDLEDSDYNKICNAVLKIIQEGNYLNEKFQEELIPVIDMHSIVENVLSENYPKVGECYRQYRNYKVDFVHMLDQVYTKEQEQRYIGDVSNANTDSTMISTQRSLSYGLLSKELYRKFFLTKEELQASNDGYIYIHDMKDRRDGINCCLFDMSKVLKDGFEMGNLWYNEPKTLDVAFDVIGDITFGASAQQYGGFTIPRVDTILAPYAVKSFSIYYKEAMELYEDNKCSPKAKDEKARLYADKKVRREFMQGFQGWEYKFNSVGSSRGDYPFIALSFGIGTSKFEKMATEAVLQVRMAGQGKKGFKKPVLFPKLTFLYDEELHGVGKPLEYLFDLACECSSKTMYPDFLSLTGEGYIPSMYKKYGKVVSLMGCRASLSPWYTKGGIYPADDEDEPVFEGRFNLGAISLHLPMILAKARQEKKDFYEVLDYYLELIRGLHKRTYDYLGEKKASTNPLGFTQGGFLGGTLRMEDKIKDLLPAMTMSYGITALNELQELYNGKSLVEDGEFAYEVMKYINEYVNRIKDEDKILYAIYATPAESLCFSGDTIVQTYKGNKCIKDIREGDLVYSYNEKSKKIELKPVVASMLTKKKAEVVKVSFTNGQNIICTPDHPFATRKMIRDNNGKFVKETFEYVRAKDLIQGNRIKSNYIIINADGHYRCTTDQFIHDINAEYFFGSKPDGYVVHHKNADKLDNSIDNLEYLLDSDHRIYHIGETVKKYQYKSENVKGDKNPFFGKKHSEATKEKNRLSHIGSKNINSKSVIKLDKNGNIIDIYESRGEAERKTGHPNLSYACNGRYTTKENSHEYKGFLWYFADDVKDLCCENHKVEAVEYLPERISVYDIEVADNHNFYVGGNEGILVHNCGLQVEQFRNKYGIVEGVSDREYVSNSFHCGVWEEITPIQKQDLEERFWDLFNGGKIQYCRYPVSYNYEAQKNLIRRAMKKGFYEGCNLALSYCEDCGYEQLEMDKCPKCSSENITQIDRMNGYIGYTKIHGKTRYNQAKVVEIKERKSM